MDERIIAALLFTIAALAVVAKATRIAYPIVFVIAGAAIAMIPGIPPLRLRPEWVFFIFLPPLLFGDGWATDFRAFKRYRMPIAMLATGPVILTTVAVAWVGHALLGLPYAVGATLGAILAPTDAVATDAIGETTPMPKRLETILSGESLINDATGLVLYKFAVAAVVSGTFSLGSVTLAFVTNAAGGLAVGIAGAFLIVRVMERLQRSGYSDSLIAVTISLVTPFALYVPADALGVSGVLAAVSGGIYTSRKMNRIFDAESRLAAAGVWNLLFFAFNGTLFLLLGLQLRTILASLTEYPLPALLFDGGVVTATVVLVRFAWIFPVSWARWRFDPHIRQREGAPPPRIYTFILAWAGMRGIVSLAAALAIPEFTASGAPFPGRDLVLFVTFTVILVTLLAQGLTLPSLLRLAARAPIDGDEQPGDEEVAHARARVALAEAGMKRLQQLEAGFVSPMHWEVAGQLREEFAQQLDHYRTHVDGAKPETDATLHDLYKTLRRETLEAARRRLAEMRYSGELPDGVYRDIQYDIDLSESRLA